MCDRETAGSDADDVRRRIVGLDQTHEIGACPIEGRAGQAHHGREFHPSRNARAEPSVRPARITNG